MPKNQFENTVRVKNKRRDTSVPNPWTRDKNYELTKEERRSMSQSYFNASSVPLPGMRYWSYNISY